MNAIDSYEVLLFPSSAKCADSYFLFQLSSIPGSQFSTGIATVARGTLECFTVLNNL